MSSTLVSPPILIFGATGAIGKNTARKLKNNKTLDKNLFSGFLGKNEFLEYIFNSKVIIAMTIRNNNLLYAPREAIQMERGGANSGMADNVRNRNYGAINRQPQPERMESNENAAPDAFISNIQPIE